MYCYTSVMYCYTSIMYCYTSIMYCYTSNMYCYTSIVYNVLLHISFLLSAVIVDTVGGKISVFKFVVALLLLSFHVILFFVCVLKAKTFSSNYQVDT